MITDKRYKDPDDLISKAKQGIEQFKISVACSKSCGNWLTENILEKYKSVIETDVGRRDAINEAIKWFKTLKDPLDKQDIRNSISKALDIPNEKWQEVTGIAQRQEAQEQYEKEMMETYSILLERTKKNENNSNSMEE